MTIVNQFVGFILLLMKINVANFVEFFVDNSLVFFFFSLSFFLECLFLLI
jgi:hypothetical protein